MLWQWIRGKRVRLTEIPILLWTQAEHTPSLGCLLLSPVICIPSLTRGRWKIWRGLGRDDANFSGAYFPGNITPASSKAYSWRSEWFLSASQFLKSLATLASLILPCICLLRSLLFLHFDSFQSLGDFSVFFIIQIGFLFYKKREQSSFIFIYLHISKYNTYIISGFFAKLHCKNNVFEKLPKHLLPSFLKRALSACIR